MGYRLVFVHGINHINELRRGNLLNCLRRAQLKNVRAKIFYSMDFF